MTTTVTDELSQAVGRVLGVPAEIVEVRSHPFQSSCALTEISARDVAGEKRELLLKDLSRRTWRPGPPSLYDERREVAVYRMLGGADGPRSPRFLGADIDAGSGRHWLFMEQVEGVPLWQSSAPAAWREAARWLASLHGLEHSADDGVWLRYDADYYARWLPRARTFSPHARLDAIEHVHSHAIERLLRAPAVLVHGDYYPSNVLVDGGEEPRVCPLDFELMGIGAGVLDLAALTTGLDRHLTDAVEKTYRARCPAPPAREELRSLVLCARLHLAVRWLGWMPGWRAPEHQRFDWVAEAHASAAALRARTTGSEAGA
jgi:aminoglycoside phosphotransferase (APT) family kinase protein